MLCAYAMLDPMSIIPLEAVTPVSALREAAEILCTDHVVVCERVDCPLLFDGIDVEVWLEDWCAYQMHEHALDFSGHDTIQRIQKDPEELARRLQATLDAYLEEHDLEACGIVPGEEVASYSDELLFI